MSDSAPPPPPPEDTGSPSTPPPPPPPPPSNGPASSNPMANVTGDQVKTAFQGANQFDLGIIGGAFLVFICSLLPYYTASVEVKGGEDIPGLSNGKETESWTAWHGFFGWFAALLALVVVVVMVAKLLNLGIEAGLARLIVLGAAAASALCVFLALFLLPDGFDDADSSFDFSFGGASIETSTGHGIGYWLSLLIAIGVVVLAFLRKDAKND